ncbi:hypothetical protein CL629_00365 [bacterium]|nr:hypothetical protein [bacterium]
MRGQRKIFDLKIGYFVKNTQLSGQIAPYNAANIGLILLQTRHGHGKKVMPFLSKYRETRPDPMSIHLGIDWEEGSCPKCGEEKLIEITTRDGQSRRSCRGQGCGFIGKPFQIK